MVSWPSGFWVCGEVAHQIETLVDQNHSPPGWDVREEEMGVPQFLSGTLKD
jgi:hypothetical protein